MMIENEQQNSDSAPEESAVEGFEALKEGVLGKVAAVLPEGALDKAVEMLDRDGDGNPLDDLQGLASRFLSRD
jgi:hypothetical protein